MGKVYLSLDTLHKLYGISPAVISAIKKKRRKRNKKDKINNGNMGSTKSSSTHMQGSSHSLVVEALNKDKMDKHIKAINDENKAIEEKEKEKLKIQAPPPPVIQPSPPILINGMSIDPNKLNMDIKNGHVTATHTGNSLILKDTRLNSKPGPKVGSKRYDMDKPYMSPVGKKSSYVNKKDNTGITSNSKSSSQFLQENNYKSTLANTSGNSLTRNESLPAFTFIDGTGEIEVGSSSDSFTNENPSTEFGTSAPPDTSVQDAIDLKIIQEEQALQDEQDKQALQELRDAQDIQDAKDEQDALNAKLELEAKDVLAKEKAKFNSFFIKDLDNIAKSNKTKFPKGVNNKEDKYNFLKNLNLIPEKK